VYYTCSRGIELLGENIPLLKKLFVMMNKIYLLNQEAEIIEKFPIWLMGWLAFTLEKSNSLDFSYQFPSRRVTCFTLGVP
jgi:hypothetical protein